MLVDGVFAPELSQLDDLEQGLAIRTLREALEAGDAWLQDQLFSPNNSDPMVALNSAMMTDGVVIEVADGAVLKQPLHIVHIAERRRSLGNVHPLDAARRQQCKRDGGRKLYRCGRRKDISGPRFLGVSIGDDARLDHVRLIEDSRDAFNISSAVITLGAHAHYNTFGMTSGSLVSRYQAVIAFAGEGSKVETNGVNLLNGRQHADTTLFMDHAVPNCASREIFRAVVDDRAHSVFQGRIIVRPEGAEDRRQDDDAGAAAVRRGRGRQQA